MSRATSKEARERKLLFEFREEWSQFLGHWNWYTFRPILVEFELDKLLGAAESTVIVLGVGFRISWSYAETRKARELSESIDELRAKGAS